MRSIPPDHDQKKKSMHSSRAIKLGSESPWSARESRAFPRLIALGPNRKKEVLPELPELVIYLGDHYFCLSRDRKDFRGSEKQKITFRNPTKSQETTYAAT
jgi:hypothetical protein